jgi:group II intron reverse transcriptase/maturase
MNVSTQQEQIAELARSSPEMSFTALNHYLNPDWLTAAFYQCRRDSAPGIDGQTMEEYAEQLELNLQTLLDRAKSGNYFAPPVKRVYIPKDASGKKTRPIGIPVVEDKILQKAVTMILEPIYEQDFLDCSYGYRPGRSPHDALDALWRYSMEIGVQTVLDLDIRKFFDSLDKTHLRNFLRHRVQDGVLTRLLGKWLNAGVMEKGTMTYPAEGVPQGGSISPLLSNIYLHYVVDVWFEEVVKPRLKGRAFMIRFSDDVVMGFETQEDAERVLAVLPKRLDRFGLSVHPDKTRLVEFARPDRKDRKGPGTFDFLGFTHYWGKSLKGNWVIKRKTAGKRLNRALKGISAWCRSNRHLSVSEQHKKLSQKLKGHFAYYGITGNVRCLYTYAEKVKRYWRKWLNRRGGKTSMTWERFQKLLQCYPLPKVRVVHSIYAAKP